MVLSKNSPMYVECFPSCVDRATLSNLQLFFTVRHDVFLTYLIQVLR